MHWQQYWTAGAATLATLCYLGSAAYDYRKAGKSMLAIAAIALGQFVLWSGGWYN